VEPARCRPRPGAAAKPRRFTNPGAVSCGVQVRVNCGYGPRSRRASPCWLHGIDERPLRAGPDPHGAGAAGPAVVAVASGVRAARWLGARGWAPYGKIVYLEHDFRDRRVRSSTFHSMPIWTASTCRRDSGCSLAPPSARWAAQPGRRMRYGPPPALRHVPWREASDPRGGQALVPSPSVVSRTCAAAWCHGLRPSRRAHRHGSARAGVAFGGLMNDSPSPLAAAPAFFVPP